MRSGSAQVEKVLKILSGFKIKSKEVNFIGGFDFHDLTLKNLSFKYKGIKKNVLKNIDLKIIKGEVIGIVGLTGSGKSTLLDIVMGLIRPTQGKVLIDNKNLYLGEEEDLIYKWRSIISHVPQNIFLKDSSFASNIAFGVSEEKIDIQRVREVAKEAKVDKFIEETKYGYQTKVGERAYN